MTLRTRLTIAVAAAFGAAVLTSTALAQTVTLRPDITATGPLVTLGDVFDGAGAAASRPIGPAPRAGASASFLPHMVERAARSAGLEWNAPGDLRMIIVRSANGGRIDGSTPSAGANSGVRKGDLVVLTFTTPGIRLTARTRAQTDASRGQTVRLVNIASNRTVDAIVTGPGRATANLDAHTSE